MFSHDVIGMICIPTWQKYLLEASFPLAGTDIVYKRLRSTMGKEFPSSYKIRASSQGCLARGKQLPGRRKGSLVGDDLFYLIIFWFQPVKDADPHFHHFLLSQTEKVSCSLKFLIIGQELA